MKNLKQFVDVLCCPVCYSELEFNRHNYICSNSSCQIYYPIVDEIPILLNEKKSIFTIDSFVQKKQTTFISNSKGKVKLKKLINKIIPSINGNYVSYEKLKSFKKIINDEISNPKILIIGSGFESQGIKNNFSKSQNMLILDTDVSFSSNIDVICDAHCLPFSNESFDAVILQAVLEHVIDPYNCVNEVKRVLKRDGFVYAETPFMQQLHQAPFDFTRFTFLGHRWLFRGFIHIDSGVVCGPGMALAWSIRGLIKNMVKNRILSRIFTIITHLCFFWLKYIDYIIVKRKSAALDSASSLFFIGRLNQIDMTFNELINYYNEENLN
ncbi:MAG: methyltransferase type 11 [Candidatus Marinimicrobia bacterium]|nr:methyltransferase type 11 [Candidatus Neomarinimicrobiota bacterium]